MSGPLTLDEESAADLASHQCTIKLPLLIYLQWASKHSSGAVAFMLPSSNLCRFLGACSGFLSGTRSGTARDVPLGGSASGHILAKEGRTSWLHGGFTRDGVLYFSVLCGNEFYFLNEFYTIYSVALEGDLAFW